MGVEFIQKKEKKFVHRRDKKFAENIQSTNLLSAAPEKIIQQFRCRIEGDFAPEDGMGVLVLRDESSINVVYLNKKIGVVMSPDSASLKRVLEAAGLELASASIVRVRPAARVFIIQLQ